MKTLNVRLSADLNEMLVNKAGEEQEEAQKIVRIALREYFSNRKGNPLNY